MTSALEQSSSYKPGRIKAVCLDIDDTLLDSEGASRRGLRALVGNERAWPVWKAITDEHYARFVAGRIDYESMCVERTRAFFAAFGQQLSAAEAVRRETARMAAVQRSWCLFGDAWPCLEWLRATGLRAADSDANFVLFGRFRDRHAVWQGLLDHGVLIRETGPDGWLRVSVGTPEETTAFREALVDVLKEHT